MTERDVDALWRSIVENYGERVVLDDPEAEDKPVPTPQQRVNDDPAGDDGDTDPEDRRDRLDAWDDPEDHFVPPPPPPLPRPEPPRLLAWAGVFGVPVLTILLTVLSISVPSWVSFFALLWFVGGFGYLVATMRKGDDDDGWDDGAVV